MKLYCYSSYFISDIEYNREGIDNSENKCKSFAFITHIQEGPNDR